MAEPRTRKNRLPRKTIRCTTTVGDDKFELTCPRCGWPCTHLVIPYHESAWAEHGGMCCECCNEAAEHYDENGWPLRPGEEPEAEPEAFEQDDLFKT